VIDTKKTFIILFVSSLFILSTCDKNKFQKFESGSFDLFDTYSNIIIYAESREEAEKISGAIYARLGELHKLFDIYNAYDGINNLKTLNDNAGVAPVEVCGEMIELLKFSIDSYRETDGAFDVALGPVLSIWRAYREEGLLDPESASVPPYEMLKEASDFCDITKIMIDEINHTVFLEQEGMSVDVGAVAKGFAAQLAIDEIIKESGVPCLIDLGGNIAAIGGPPGRSRTGGAWNVGVWDPLGVAGYIKIVAVTDLSVVTSGDYQRYYEAGGARYNHIVDPKTLIPADGFRSVTVIHPDSGVADMLSTAMFILSYEEGSELAEKFGAGALWVTRGGEQITNGEFDKYIVR